MNKRQFQNSTQPSIDWQPTDPVVRDLLAVFLQHTPDVYVVGGVVRDALLGRSATMADLDLVTETPALPLARTVADAAGWAFYAMDAERDVARLVRKNPAADGLDWVCDVAGLRGQNLTEDLLARDFTLNAMAFGLQPEGSPYLIDVCSGATDLARSILRPVTEQSLVADPIRLLRAVRFAGKFDLTLAPGLSEQLRALAPQITTTSAERIRDELWKILALPRPDESLALMEQLGLLPYVLPEVSHTQGVAQSPPHRLDVFAHTLRAVREAARLRAWLNEPAANSCFDFLTPWRQPLQEHFNQWMAAEHGRKEWLLWSALLHDVGKPPTRTEEVTGEGTRFRFFGHETISAQMAEDRLTHLHFSRREIQLAQTVVDGHMRPHNLIASFPDGRPSRRALFRFVRDAGGRIFSLEQGDPAAVDVLCLALADLLATAALPEGELPPTWPVYAAQAAEILAFVYDREPTALTPLVNGRQLMETLHLPTGPQIGRLLSRLAEAQAANEIQTAEEALDLAKKWTEEIP